MVFVDEFEDNSRPLPHGFFAFTCSPTFFLSALLVTQRSSKNDFRPGTYQVAVTQSPHTRRAANGIPPTLVGSRWLPVNVTHLAQTFVCILPWGFVRLTSVKVEEQVEKGSWRDKGVNKPKPAACGIVSLPLSKSVQLRPSCERIGNWGSPSKPLDTKIRPGYPPPCPRCSRDGA